MVGREWIREAVEEGAAGIAVQAIGQRRRTYLLLGTGRHHVKAAGQHFVGECDRRGRGAQRAGVRERPYEQLVRAPGADGHAIAVRLIRGVGAEEVLGAAIGRRVETGRGGGGPDRKARVPVVHSVGVDLGHGNGGRALR